MVHSLTLGDLVVDVVRKDIKNLHLSVHPPTGRVRIAAPQGLGMDAIRAYAISKISWIRANQKRLYSQVREPVRDYVERESHYIWGERVLLRVQFSDGLSGVQREHRALLLTTKENASQEERHQLVEAWYREELRKSALPALARWEGFLGVKAQALYIQRMKTKWGSCNPTTRNIRLNTELTKKPFECLDYVILHELVHIIERTHSEKFYGIMDHAFPAWRDAQRLLNSLPLPEVID